MKRTVILSLIAIMVGMSQVQAVSITGQTVQVQHHFPAIGAVEDSATVIVVDEASPTDPVELVNFGPLVGTVDPGFNIDIDGNQITITDTIDPFELSSSPAIDFNGWVISDVTGTLGDFTNVSLDASTFLGSPVLPTVTYDSDNIFIDAEGVNLFYIDFGVFPFENTAKIVVNFDTVDNGGDPPPAHQPEPSTLIMFIVSLLGACGVKFWKRRRTV